MEICYQTCLQNLQQIRKELFGWRGEEEKFILMNTFSQNDIVIVFPNGTMQISFTFSTKTEFKKELISGDKAFLKPHSNAFIDVDNDFTAGRYYLQTLPRKFWNEIALKYSDVFLMKWYWHLFVDIVMTTEDGYEVWTSKVRDRISFLCSRNY